MQDSDTLDEPDLELINALQLAPRASWAELSAVLDNDATTLARRWRRLSDAGIARVIAYPRHRMLARAPMAYVELTCRNGRVMEVATALAEDPGTLSIQFTAGAYHLLLTVGGVRDLSAYLLEWIGGFTDVVGYRMHVVTGTPYEASRWQVRALSAPQRRRLRALAPAELPAPEGGRLSDLDQRIIDRVSVDGRVSYRDLAADLGVSPTTATRRLTRLLGSGVIGLRCDIARAELGWPTSAILWGSVDPQILAGARTDLGERIPELRLCSTIVGPENTHFVLWLRSIGELQRVEQRLTEELPGLRIADRRVVLRTVKLMGQILDDQERYARAVPLRLLPPTP